MALSTVSGILTRIGMGKLGRLGLEPARRYERERPGELVHIDVKKLGRIEGGAGKRVDGSTPLQPHAHRLAGKRRRPSAGSSSTSRSTTAPGSPTPRCSATRRRPRRSPSCAGRSPSSSATASRSSGADRQRIRLSLDRARDRLPGARHPPPAHPPLPPPDQRQGGALHPHVLGGWAYGAIYRRAQSAPRPLTAGYGATTITEDIRLSATSPRSLGSPSEPTCSGLTASGSSLG